MKATTLENIRQKIGVNRITTIFGIIFLISQVIIASNIKLVSPMEALRLQMTLFSDVFVSIINQWIHTGVYQYYVNHFYFDFFHPFWYTLFFCSLIASGLNLNNLSADYNYKILIPVIAAICDLIENLIHVYLISDMSHVNPFLVAISGLFSNIKWILLLYTIVQIILLRFFWDED